MNNTANFNFNNAAYNTSAFAAQNAGKNESRMKRIKIGLIIAAAAQLVWVIALILSVTGLVEASNLLTYIAYAESIGAFIVGGGMWAGMKKGFEFAKRIAGFAFVCIPFPLNFPVCAMLAITTVVVFPIFLLYLPLPLVFLNYRRMKNELTEAADYQQYYTPVSAY